MKSYSSVLNPVSFPVWTGLRAYMVAFRKNIPLPDHLQTYQDTVDQILLNVDTDEEMFLMIDEKFVKEGEYHRRPGIHVDGYWNPSLSTHGPGRHTGVQNRPEGLLLASNTGDSRALIGEFERDFITDWRGGDCSDLDTSSLKSVYLEPNVVHAADVMTLHESLPVKRDCFRTLVRINVPNYIN